ncbi:hypothetical protein GCM10023340_45490 [Nocardioides marinquilinus]|uniref:Uncharacterized protein n=1 Tax=Nocardioides marinquilinus TaxID=1210400 RepID=A0ABP9Q4S6_9ACTN
MSWLALLLVGLGLTDLVFSLTRRPWAGQVAGAVSVLVLGPLAGLTTAGGVVAWLLLAVAVAGWGVTVTVGFARGWAWLPLGWLGIVLALTLAVSGAAAPVDGPLGAWLADLPVLDGDPGRALMVAGAVLVQLVTGNVVVRLVLEVSGTSHPTPGASSLKGGRLLGPMERVAILGLGLAGELTAAGVVVAAKGLLRFPELQAAAGGAPGPGIHDVTEYFLVGSFVSWSVSLGTLALVA